MSPMKSAIRRWSQWIAFQWDIQDVSKTTYMFGKLFFGFSLRCILFHSVTDIVILWVGGGDSRRICIKILLSEAQLTQKLLSQQVLQSCHYCNWTELHRGLVGLFWLPQNIAILAKDFVYSRFSRTNEVW